MRIYIPEIDKTTKSIYLFLTTEEISQLQGYFERMENEPIEDDHVHFEDDSREIIISKYDESRRKNQFAERFQKVIFEDE